MSKYSFSLLHCYVFYILNNYIICIIHCLAFGKHNCLKYQIDIVHNSISSDRFYNLFIANSKPVIFKNAAKLLPAFDLWTDSYLSTKFGDIEVSAETRKKEIRGNKPTKLLLRQFLSEYTTNLSQHYVIHELSKDFKSDLCLPRWFHCGGHRMTSAVLWFSSGGSTSVLHRDALDNFNCILDGSKDIVLIDKVHRSKVEVKGWSRRGLFHSLDVDDFNPVGFADLASLRILEARAYKGDCVYIPSGWYHVVRSSEGRNMAVNVWLQPLLYYNASDCAPSMHVTNKVFSSSNIDHNIEDCYPLNKWTISHHGDSVKYDLFEHFIGKGTLDKKDVISTWTQSRGISNIGQHLALEMFYDIDANGDGILSWAEITKFDMQTYMLESKEMRNYLNSRNSQTSNSSHLDQSKLYLDDEL